MSERYTQKDAKLAFYMLAEACGKSTETTLQNPRRANIGAWRLSTNFFYGGHVIEEIHNDGWGISNPFGHTRRNHREFCEFVSATLHGIRIGREQNRK